MNARVPGAGDYLQVAARVWQEPLKEPSSKPQVPTGQIKRVLAVSVFASEDTAQRFVLGAGVVGSVTGDGRFVPDEGPDGGASVLFYPDDLPESDPDAFAVLVAVADESDAHLVTSNAFAHGWIRWFCCPRLLPDGSLAGDATLVLFDAPFVLSRVAVKTGREWSRNRRTGGFTLDLVPLYECRSGLTYDRLVPRVEVKHESAAYAQVDFQKLRQPRNGQHVPLDMWSDLIQRRILDLRSLTCGLSGETVSFSRACELYGVGYEPGGRAEVTAESVRLCLADTQATGHLAARTLAEFYALPLQAPDGQSYVQTPCRVWSQATLAKASLRAMGVTPPMRRDGWDQSPDLMGLAMEAYYGARCETRIRCTPVPVAVCDFSAMYPAVSSLMGMWELVTADQLRVVEATEQVSSFLAGISEATLLDRTTWRDLPGFVLVQPDGRDILPVRARYGGGEGEYTVGLNSYRGAGPQWFTVADVAASVLLTGDVPQVVKAVRLVASGTIRGLRPMHLHHARIDPRSADFWKTVVEIRKTLDRKGHPDSCSCEQCRTSRFLKLMINSGSYGVFAELNREDTDRAGARTLHNGRDRRMVSSRVNEKPGMFCYPPLASVITGAGRLMLALLEHMVTSAGGTYAASDTDSLHIVADATSHAVDCPTPDGTNAVRALSFQEVDRIRDRINALNPYDRTAVPDLLKREVPADMDTTWCYAISPKRYVLYRLDNGQPVVRAEVDGKEAIKQHGLGIYLSPDGSGQAQWIGETWQWILGRHYGLDPAWPVWEGAHAVSKYQVATPAMLRLFSAYNATAGDQDRIRPFTKILVAITDKDFDPEGESEPSAPYIAPMLDRGAITGDVWINRNDPSHRLVTLPNPRTMRQILLDHTRKRDPKLTGLRTGLQERRLVGLLGGQLQTIGKEASDLAEAIVFKDHTAKTTYWPQVHSRDALLAFDGLSAIEVAQIINDESRDLLAKIRKERAHQPSTSAADEREREVRKAYGSPVTVSDRAVRRWRAGEGIDLCAAQTIERVAARLIAARLGIEPGAIRHDENNPRAGRYKPETVLSMWRDYQARQESSRSCQCGCGQKTQGKRIYATPACKQRAYRARK